MRLKAFLINILSSIFLLTSFFGVYSTETVFATSYTLSGHVSNSSGNPIVSATIKLEDPNTNANLGSTTTDSLGNYNLVVNSGTYNVQVIPPSDSNFGPAIAPNFEISGDKILNFILVPAGTVMLSGHIYDPSDNPLPNQIIRLGGGPTIPETTSDSSGYYSIEFLPNVYNTINIASGSSNSGLNVPDFYHLDAHYSLSQNTVIDITLPTKQVHVYVQDSSGNAIKDVKISVTNSQMQGLSLGNNLTVYGGNSGFNQISTGNNGDATAKILPGTYSFKAEPPAGSGVMSSVISVSIPSETAESTITITLPPLPPIYTLSGHVYNPSGNPIPNVSIRFGGGPTIPSTATDNTGFYSLDFQPGVYSNINIASGSSDSGLNIPDFYHLDISWPFSQSAIINFTLPTKQVHVRVQDGSGNAVENTKISVTNSQIQGLSLGNNLTVYSGNTSSNPVLTDNKGNATLLLFPGSYTIKADPLTGSGFVSTSVNISVPPDSTESNVIITLPAPPPTYNLNGHVYDASGSPVPNQLIRFGGGPTIPSTTTDTSGFYSLDFSPGTYSNINVAGGALNSGLNIPDSYHLDIPWPFSQSAVANFTIPTKLISVYVQDGSGDAVGNTKISVTNSNVQGLSLGNGFIVSNGSVGANPVFTDNNGNALLRLVPGIYTFRADPPSDGIYQSYMLNNITIISNQTELISLQYNHAAPTTTANLSPTPNSDGIYPDPVTVALSATAATGFSIVSTYYAVDGETQQTYSVPFTVSGEGNHTVIYWSVDNSGVQESPKTKIFTIHINIAPAINPLSDAAINLQDEFIENGSFTDDDSTAWLGSVDYGNGSGIQQLPLNGKNFTLNYIYQQAGQYVVTVNITDNQGATATHNLTVVVNGPPQVNPFPPGATVNEGEIYSVTGSFTDPDSTSWTATVDYGDGLGALPLSLSDTTFQLNHVYKDNGTYMITVSVTDNQGATGIGTATITVNNIPPSVGTITAPTTPALVNTSITASADFTDPGVFDTHTASWNWGDGNTTTGTITESNGSGSVTDSHIYTTTGVYIITLAITDNNSGIGTGTFQYVSVYNPTPQGLFSGARIFTSPAGAYFQNTNLTGKVMFGVSVKYKETTPTGNVSMNFKEANFNFTATSVDSLVTSNGMATVRGSGAVNGSANYKFLVTGADSSVSGESAIRFQIKDPSDTVIYDTQPGVLDIATPTTPITGQVIVH